ncbi:lipoprotein insertase outer membrane protein LolB [Azospira restricta]|uniref:Outer-membrane lipoprotein LolB n=1 Tax=Azospira restricta TaxID=404405 RepID=A0A974SPF3_9RHOO|nr:lipoprotein insertase outer membrane protein LolB [Azospira restricta]QRJ64016.1 outer membrane lipoprotein LolB [Azospira restricta]
MPRFLSLLLALAVAACATVPPPAGGLPARDAVGDFGLDARFSLTYAMERHAGRLAWVHRGAGDELRISSPFGQTVAEISVDPQQARLVAADGQVREAAGAEQLLHDVLGYPLPIGSLAAWVLARPRPGAQLEADAQGRPRRIVDDGWQIDYDYDDAAADALPSRLVVTRDGGPELRLRIEEWRAP